MLCCSYTWATAHVCKQKHGEALKGGLCGMYYCATAEVASRDAQKAGEPQQRIGDAGEEGVDDTMEGQSISGASPDAADGPAFQRADLEPVDTRKADPPAETSPESDALQEAATAQGDIDCISQTAQPLTSPERSSSPSPSPTYSAPTYSAAQKSLFSASRTAAACSAIGIPQVR
jgi:hypothetical protein